MSATSLRAMAKELWRVSDLGEQLQFAAGSYAGYFDKAEDALAGNILDTRVPRTGAIALIGYQASEKLGLAWKVEAGRAIGQLAGATVIEVSHVGTEYLLKTLKQPAPATLHLAALHGITLLRAGEPKAPTRQARRR